MFVTSTRKRLIFGHFEENSSLSSVTVGPHEAAELFNEKTIREALNNGFVETSTPSVVIAREIFA